MNLLVVAVFMTEIKTTVFYFIFRRRKRILKNEIQPVSYKRYFRCNNCFLLLVYTIHLSLSTNLVDPPPMHTIYMKHPLQEGRAGRIIFRGLLGPLIEFKGPSVFWLISLKRPVYIIQSKLK